MFLEVLINFVEKLWHSRTTCNSWEIFGYPKYQLWILSVTPLQGAAKGHLDTQILHPGNTRSQNQVLDLSGSALIVYFRFLHNQIRMRRRPSCLWIIHRSLSLSLSLELECSPIIIYIYSSKFIKPGRLPRASRTCVDSRAILFCVSSSGAHGQILPLK